MTNIFFKWMLAFAVATPMLTQNARAQTATVKSGGTTATLTVTRSGDVVATKTAPDGTIKTVTTGAPTSADDVSPLKIGLKMPDVTLRDSTGAQYELTKSLANGPAILVFYRGGWCPYCNTQLSGLSKIEPQLLKMGYRIFAISPDTPEELSKTLVKNNLPYKLLSDSKMEVTRALGLAFQVDAETVGKYKEYGIDLGKSENMLPVPAVYLVGRDGIVDFSYVNPDYKTRVPEELILAAAQVFAPQK